MKIKFYKCLRNNVKIRYEKSFEKDLRKLKNKSVKIKIKEKIVEIKGTDNPTDLSGLKKIGDTKTIFDFALETSELV